jgi:ABC-2 type transport system ATP-binding protein
MSALIEARGLRRVFGQRTAVDGVSLSVEAGEVFALVGPDGAGKTTTIRLLCGALRTDEGSILLAGIDLARHPEQARSQIGYLPQRFSLYGELTVLENLQFFAEVRGLPGAEWQPRSAEILDFVGLSDFADRRAEALSGGMRQKLGLAAALVHRPRILLLDEPTGGVDPVTRQSFWQLVIRLLGQGVGVLITTPYMDEAARCSRVGFLSRGRLLVDGPPQQVTQTLQGRILEVVGAPRQSIERVARDHPLVEDVQSFGDRLHLRLAPGVTEVALSQLREGISAAGARLDRIRAVAPSLEDAFIDLLQRDSGAPIEVRP